MSRGKKLERLKRDLVRRIVICNQARLDRGKQNVEQLAGGMARVDRKQRANFSYRESQTYKFVPRDMKNANLKTFVRKAINRHTGKLPFEHLSFNWK